MFVAQADIPPTTHLIFADADGIGHRLAARLRRREHRVVLVYAGKAYQSPATDAAIIRRDNPNDYRQLLADLPPLNTIVYLWGLDAGESPTVAPLYSVMHLVQAMVAHGDIAARLWLVTQDVIPTPHGNVTAPGLAQSPLWGMGKVIALEYPAWWGGLVDIATASDADALIAEILAQPNEPYLALHHGSCYVARLRPEMVTPAPPPDFGTGTYLITGGLGYLGLRFAHWLCEQGVTNLVLVGRQPPPSDAEASLAQLREKIAQAGGTLRVEQADVADRAQMQHIIAACERLHGVVHAAGIASHRPLETLTRADIDAVSQAKIYGAWLLHELTLEQPLVHFIYFSSAGSVWGAKGQAHYDAASHFLDSLAHYRRALGLPALTLNWGMLAGERLAHNEYFRWLTGIGMQDMPVEQAWQAVAHLLGTGATQAVVAAMDWQRFKPVYEWRGPHPLLSDIAPGDVASAPVTPLEPPTPPQDITAQLQAEVAGLLHLAAPPDPDAGFFELGLDSLMMLELRNQITQRLGVELTLDSLETHATIADLAAFIASRTPSDTSADDWVEVTL